MLFHNWIFRLQLAITLFCLLFSCCSPGGSDGKASACNGKDLGLITGLGRSPGGGGHDNPLQYSCLENPHRQRSLSGFGPWGHKESNTMSNISTHSLVGLPWWLSGKESAYSVGDTGDAGSVPRLGRSPGGGRWQPAPVFLQLKIAWTEEPGELWPMRSQRDTTEATDYTHTHTHTHTHYILLLIQHFACMTSCNFHNKPMRQVLFSVFVHQWELRFKDIKDLVILPS